MTSEELKKIEEIVEKIGRQIPHRWFSRASAAEYLEVSVSFFDAKVKPHLTPSNLNTPLRYDKEDIDRFMVARRVEL